LNDFSDTLLGDVSRFEKLSKQVVAFAGLDSLEKSSAGKTRFGRISKAGSPLLRGLLGQSANIVIRYDARLKAFYKGLAKRKPKVVAKTATARRVQDVTKSFFPFDSLLEYLVFYSFQVQY
jgi:transposase